MSTSTCKRISITSWPSMCIRLSSGSKYDISMMICITISLQKISLVVLLKVLYIHWGRKSNTLKNIEKTLKYSNYISTIVWNRKNTPIIFFFEWNTMLFKPLSNLPRTKLTKCIIQKVTPPRIISQKLFSFDRSCCDITSSSSTNLYFISQGFVFFVEHYSSFISTLNQCRCSH